MSLKFRPHHFLCALGFQGRGYSPEFVKNFEEISRQLSGADGDLTPIEVVSDTDSICSPCPNRRESLCVTEEKIRKLDQAHQKMLNLTIGETLSWGQAKEKMIQQVDDLSFNQACEPCSWRALGVCQKALDGLRKSVAIGVFLALVFQGGFTWAGVRHEAHRQPARKPSEVEKKIKKVQDLLPRDVRLLRSAATWASIPKNSIFYDHAQALLARRYQAQAEKSLMAGRWKVAQSQAQEAQRHWLRIQEHCSSSPWLRRFSEEMGRADLVIAQALSQQRQRISAREAFERAWDRVPFSVVTAEQISSYFEVCQKTLPGFWKSPSSGACAGWARRLIGAFVRQAPERTELSKKWQVIFDEFSDVPAAVAAPRVQQVYRQADEDTQAWDAVLPLIRDRKLRQIQRPLREFLEKYPRSALRQKARYWLAVSLEEYGESPSEFSPLLETVAKESPLSFYGLLASQRLKKNPEDFLVAFTPDLKSSASRLHPSEAISLEKSEWLLKAADPVLSGLAQMDLREIRPRETHETDFLVYLAELHSRAGSHLGAFAAVTELIQRAAKPAASTWAAQVVFPVERWTQILQSASANQIDPVWVLSLMKQESAFDATAISSSGAVGLMQLMPATAVSTESTIRRVDLSRDENNIRIGTAYMAEMFRRFRGNIALATAAYNAGPNAVERWMREFGLKDTENGLSLGIIEFIESIPYKETRDYVGSIIRNYHWYSRRIPQETKPLQYFWIRNVPSALPSNKPAAD